MIIITNAKSLIISEINNSNTKDRRRNAYHDIKHRSFIGITISVMALVNSYSNMSVKSFV